MKNFIFKMIIFIICCLFSIIHSYANDIFSNMSQDNPISQQGTVSFILHTDKTYSNGVQEQDFTQTLLALPGLGKCILEKSCYSIFIYFQWDSLEVHKGFYIIHTDLPGPHEYAVLFTWDADKGLADGYMNGTPFRTEKANYYEPWQMKGKATEFNVPSGPNKVTDVKILTSYMPQEKTVKHVPETLRNKMSYLPGPQTMVSPLNIHNRKGKLLYESKMNDSTSVQDWVLEGPADIHFEDDKMIMRSQIPNPPDGSTGHFNFWCPAEFPDNIVIEWEFQPLSEHGVCHIFFAARGKNGEDVFDPTLPERDGHFQQYINGAIHNYYIIYFSNRRLMRTTNLATTWFVKSSPASLMTMGKIAVTPGDKRFHSMCLVVKDAHIQLTTDDQVYLDYTDPGNDRWGPVFTGGKISFRQMAETVAAYRNFKVWELQ